MTSTRTNPITRLVARLLPAQAPPPPAPPPEEEELDPTVKMYRFIKYGD
ncbi:MAG: hypothetical protein VKL98_05760 [Cyanobacteriota bacterium]|nr:hypothetical protein [Cyanobacteriota bacterium]